MPTVEDDVFHYNAPMMEKLSLEREKTEMVGFKYRTERRYR